MLCLLFDVEKSTLSEHLSNIYASGELDENSTVRKFRTVQQEGNRQVYKRLLELFLIPDGNAQVSSVVFRIFEETSYRDFGSWKGIIAKYMQILSPENKTGGVHYNEEKGQIFCM